MSYNFVLHNNLHLTRTHRYKFMGFLQINYGRVLPCRIRSDEDRASGVWHYMEFCVLWHLASLPVPGIPFPGLDQRPADTGKRVMVIHAGIPQRYIHCTVYHRRECPGWQ
jgi:hypothetical protein